MTSDKQKDRLVELFEQLEYKSLNYEIANKIYPFDDYKSRSEVAADYLLADGWMRPPVKVGQSFWHIEEYTHELLPDKYPTVKIVCESKVEKIFIEKYGNSFGDTRKSFSFHDIGKTVFLAKEEAEAKLKEGVQG